MKKHLQVTLIAVAMFAGGAAFAGPHHRHHNDGLHLAAGIVNLVADVLAPAPVTVAPVPTYTTPAPVVVTPAAVYTPPVIYRQTLYTPPVYHYRPAPPPRYHRPVHHRPAPPRHHRGHRR